MGEAMTTVGEGILRFWQELTLRGVDPRIVVVSTQSETFGCTAETMGICVPPPLAGPSCASAPPAFVHVSTRVWQDNVVDVLGQTYDMWRDVLRPEARKVLILASHADPPLSQLQIEEGIRAVFPGEYGLGVMSCASNCAIGVGNIGCLGYLCLGTAAATLIATAQANGGLSIDYCAVGPVNGAPILAAAVADYALEPRCP
jgi:hypothetical protein